MTAPREQREFFAVRTVGEALDRFRPERRTGTERLVRELEKSNEPKQKAALSWILKGLTGEALGEDPKAWKEWLEKKKK